MADTPHGSCALLAEAHLRASGFSNEGVGGNSGGIAEQSACLAKWATDTKRHVNKNIVSGLKKIEPPSAEHEVYWNEAKNLAVKLTLNGAFGITINKEGVPVAANPLFYLSRLNLMNAVFGSEVDMIGIIMEKSMVLFEPECPRIVIVQPWIKPKNADSPSPSRTEIKDLMTSLGFEEIPKSYFGWRRHADQVLVYDARPDNFILCAKGIIPIDLVVSKN